MQEVVIVAATRTAIGSFQGALANVSAVDLGAAVIRQLLAQTGLDVAEVDEVIMGQVLTAGAGQNPARQSAIKAGLPFTVPAMTLNKVCGSGLKALHLATQAIRCGDADVIIAGGQENMSLSNYVMPGARTGHDVVGQAHVFLAAGNDHVGIAAANCLSGQVQRLEARAADLVQGHRWHGEGQAGLDCRLARRVLSGAGGQHLAHDYFIDFSNVQTGLRQQLTDYRSTEVYRGHVGQGTLETADGSAGGGDNDDFLHGMIPHWAANCISGT